MTVSQGHCYPTHTPAVHGAIGAGASHLRASTGAAHQGAQRAAVEFSLFDLGRDPAAVGGAVKITRVLVLGSLPQEPSRTGQAVGGASFSDHGSSSEGFAHDTDQPLGFRLLCRQLAEKFQRRGDGRHQHQNIRAEG